MPDFSAPIAPDAGFGSTANGMGRGLLNGMLNGLKVGDAFDQYKRNQALMPSSIFAGQMHNVASGFGSLGDFNAAQHHVRNQNAESPDTIGFSQRVLNDTGFGQQQSQPAQGGGIQGFDALGNPIYSAGSVNRSYPAPLPPPTPFPGQQQQQQQPPQNPGGATIHIHQSPAMPPPAQGQGNLAMAQGAGNASTGFPNMNNPMNWGN